MICSFVIVLRGSCFILVDGISAIIAAPLGIAACHTVCLVLINEGEVAFAFLLVAAGVAYLDVVAIYGGSCFAIRVTVRGNGTYVGDGFATGGASNVLAVSVFIAACILAFDGNGGVACVNGYGDYLINITVDNLDM